MRGVWLRVALAAGADLASLVVCSGVIHCANGWIYERDKETNEDAAMGRWMCPEGKAIEAGRS